jgi:hypothetical protein
MYILYTAEKNALTDMFFHQKIVYIIVIIVLINIEHAYGRAQIRKIVVVMERKMSQTSFILIC